MFAQLEIIFFETWAVSLSAFVTILERPKTKLSKRKDIYLSQCSGGSFSLPLLMQTILYCTFPRSLLGLLFSS